MYYVYQLADLLNQKKQTGITGNLRELLSQHRICGPQFCSSEGKWSVEVVVAFPSREKALEFSKYLGTTAGKRFSKRHFTEGKR